MTNYYDILGVGRGAEDVVVKAAYRAMMARYHPDAFKDDPARAERMSKLINEAYAVLRDPSRRSAYDARLQAAEREAARKTSEEQKRASGTPPPPPPPPPPAPPPRAPAQAVYAAWSENDARGRRHMWIALLLPILSGLALLQANPKPSPATSFDPAPVETAAAPTQAADSFTGASEVTAVDGPGSAVEASSEMTIEMGGMSVQNMPSQRATRDEFGTVADVEALSQSEASSETDTGSMGTAADVEALSETEPAPNRRPDMSLLSSEDRSTIEVACVGKYGVVAKNACLREEAAKLREGNRRPDFSRVSSEDRSTIEVACVGKYGIVAKNACLREEAARLREGNRRPDLSQISSEDRSTIEVACIGQYGIVAKNRCLRSELRSLLGR